VLLCPNNRRPDCCCDDSPISPGVDRMQASYICAKTIMDVVLALLALILLSPALCIISLAILVDSGSPVLFRQDRLGRGGRQFTMYKFRTMIVGAESRARVKSDGSLLTGEDDPRITAVGRWLRKTSLDELPQLLNVIAGNMSIVGPRPDLPWQEQYYQEADRVKLRVKPGITGLAQVSGRNELPWAERLALDAQYVRECSLSMDIAIIFRTVG